MLRRRAFCFLFVPVLACVLFTASASAQYENLEIREWTIPELVRTLEASTATRIADVGAGDGFFAERIAKAILPGGRVTAQDIDLRSLERLRDRIRRDRIPNVDVIVGTVDDPKLGVAQYDGVLIRNAYHEMTEHAAMLRRVREALKPGGRLVIVEKLADARKDWSRADQVSRHEIALDTVEREVVEAGFEIRERIPRFDTELRNKEAGSYWLLKAVRPAGD